MPTGNVILDTTQYVKISDGIESLILQSHRDTVRITVSDLQPSLDNDAFHEIGGAGAAGRQNMLQMPFTDGAVWALAMTDHSKLSITAERARVEVSNRNTIGVPVFVQDQTSESLDVLFLETLNVTTVAADTVRDTNIFTATAGHGIVIGNIIEIADSSTFIQAYVVNVIGDAIEIDSFINHVYVAGSTLVVSNRDMNVNASPGAPRIFSVLPGPDQAGDLVRVNINMESSSSMDFSTFGSLPKLTYGCLIRIKRPNGDYINLFNWKSNGEFILRSFDHSFQNKTGGGQFGFVSRSTWGGQSKRGVVIRVEGSLGEELQIVVMDDLTGLNICLAVAQGHELQEG